MTLRYITDGCRCRYFSVETRRHRHPHTHTQTSAQALLPCMDVSRWDETRHPTKPLGRRSSPHESWHGGSRSSWPRLPCLAPLLAFPSSPGRIHANVSHIYIYIYTYIHITIYGCIYVYNIYNIWCNII